MQKIKKDRHKQFYFLTEKEVKKERRNEDSEVKIKRPPETDDHDSMATSGYLAMGH